MQDGTRFWAGQLELEPHDDQQYHNMGMPLGTVTCDVSVRSAGAACKAQRHARFKKRGGGHKPQPQQTIPSIRTPQTNPFCDMQASMGQCSTACSMQGPMDPSGCSSRRSIHIVLTTRFASAGWRYWQ